MTTIRDLDTIEQLLGAVTLVTAVFSIVGLMLAEAGHFSALAVLGIAAPASAAVLAAARRALGGAASRTAPREWAALVVLLLGAGFLFRPPADALVGGSDESVYLATGRIIAATGSLRPADPFLSSLPADLLADLFSIDQIPPARLNYFPGGLQIGLDGRVEPGFFHLGPAMMAIADACFGPTAGSDVNWLFGLFAVALIWAVARRLCGSTWAALAAGAMLAVNFAEVWFARFPTTEMPAQALTLAALLFLLVLAETRSTAAAGVAGTAAGLAGLCRLDVLLMVTAPLLVIAAGFAIAVRASRRAWTAFVIVGGALAGYAALHAWLFARAYTMRVLNIVISWRAVGDPRVPAALAVGVVALWLLWRRARSRRWLGILGGAAAGGGAVWLAIIAFPRLMASPVLPLVTPLGAGLAVAGLVTVLVTRPAASALPVATVFLVSAFALLQSPRDLTLMPIILRRFVPVLLPTGLLLATGALSTLARGPLARLAAVVAAGFIIVPAFASSRVLVATPPEQGIRPQIERLADAIPAGALTIFGRDSPSHLALAMRYQFGRDSLALSGAGGHDALRRVASQALGAGRRVYVVVAPQSDRPDGLKREDFGSLRIQPVGIFPLQFQTFESADTSRLPQTPITVAARVDLYELTSGTEDVAPLPLTIDIGGLDFARLLSGFHGPETMQGTTVRWTDGSARVAVPPLQLLESAPLIFRCRLAAPVPMGVPLPTVSLAIDGEAVASFPVTSGPLAEYRVTVPSGIAARLRHGGVIELRTPSFVPVDAGMPGDHRRLGVAIDWIALGL